MHIISNYLAQTPEQERKAQISKVHSLQSVRFVSPFYQLAFFPPCCHFWRILSSHSERGWIYFKNKAKHSTGSTENTQVGSEFSWENQVLTRAPQKTESLESAFWSDFQGLEKRKTKGISGSSHCHRHIRLLGMRLDYKSGNQRNQPIFSFFYIWKRTPIQIWTTQQHETQDACFGRKLPVRARKVQESLAQTPKGRTEV